MRILLSRKVPRALHTGPGGCAAAGPRAKITARVQPEESATPRAGTVDAGVFRAFLSTVCRTCACPIFCFPSAPYHGISHLSSSVARALALARPFSLARVRAVSFLLSRRRGWRWQAYCRPSNRHVEEQRSSGQPERVSARCLCHHHGPRLRSGAARGRRRLDPCRPRTLDRCKRQERC